MICCLMVQWWILHITCISLADFSVVQVKVEAAGGESDGKDDNIFT